MFVVLFILSLIPSFCVLVCLFLFLFIYNSWLFSLSYVTVLRKNGLIAGLAKIDFFPEMASTKLRYCLSKI